MYCSQCGKELPDDAKFCQNCGKSIDGSSEHSSRYEPPSYSQSLRRSPTGKALTIISVIITCIGLLIALFSDYLELSVKTSQISFFGTSTKLISYDIGLFTIPDVMGKLQTVGDYTGTQLPDSLNVLYFVFFVWIVDIIISAILLIRRFTHLSGANGKYVSLAWYIPLTPVITSVILNVALNSVEQNTFSVGAEISGSMYLLAALFVADFIISRVGKSFNGKIEYYEWQEREKKYMQENKRSGSNENISTATRKYWKCRYCGRLNDTNVYFCQECGKDR